jgi:hypothetical protein
LNKNYYNTILEATDPLKREKLEFDKSDDSRFWLNMKIKNKDTHAEEVRGKVRM